MEKRPCISVGQMFSLLFVSRMVITITYGTLLIGDSDIWDHLISAGISFLATFLIILPIYKLFSMDKKMNIFDNFRDLMGKFGYAFILIYVFYFIVITFHTLTIFNNFISNAINPPLSIPLLSVFLLLSSCYGAFKGLEALGRTCTFIIVATILSFTFLAFSLFCDGLREQSGTKNEMLKDLRKAVTTDFRVTRSAQNVENRPHARQRGNKRNNVLISVPLQTVLCPYYRRMLCVCKELFFNIQTFIKYIDIYKRMMLSYPHRRISQ